jgi:hypothetical protein
LASVEIEPRVLFRLKIGEAHPIEKSSAKLDGTRFAGLEAGAQKPIEIRVESDLIVKRVRRKDALRLNLKC